MQRFVLTMIAVLVIESVSGCSSLFHNLQPHRLRMLNRGPAPALDPEFSAVSDPTTPLVLVNSGQPVTVRAQQ